VPSTVHDGRKRPARSQGRPGWGELDKHLRTDGRVPAVDDPLGLGQHGGFNKIWWLITDLPDVVQPTAISIVAAWASYVPKTQRQSDRNGGPSGRQCGSSLGGRQFSERRRQFSSGYVTLGGTVRLNIFGRADRPTWSPRQDLRCESGIELTPHLLMDSARCGATEGARKESTAGRQIRATHAADPGLLGRDRETGSNPGHQHPSPRYVPGQQLLKREFPMSACPEKTSNNPCVRENRNLGVRRRGQVLRAKTAARTQQRLVEFRPDSDSRRAGRRSLALGVAAEHSNWRRPNEYLPTSFARAQCLARKPLAQGEEWKLHQIRERARFPLP